MIKAHGIADTVSARKLDGCMLDRDDRSHQVKHDQLVDTVDEVADDVAGDHFTALGHVEDLSAEQAEDNGYRH